MPICKKCASQFPNYADIAGIRKNISNRAYCLSCSPWTGVVGAKKSGLRKGRSSERVGDDELKKIVAESRSFSDVLQLDHINGVKDDNRIENLRIICPNCHTQTVTFCARNRIKARMV